MGKTEKHIFHLLFSIVLCDMEMQSTSVPFNSRGLQGDFGQRSLGWNMLKYFLSKTTWTCAAVALLSSILAL